MSLSCGPSSFIRASTCEEIETETETARELHPLLDLRSGVQNACCACYSLGDVAKARHSLRRDYRSLERGWGAGDKGTHMKMLPTQLCASPGLGTGLHMNTEGNMRNVERSNRNDNNNSTIVPFVS